MPLDEARARSAAGTCARCSTSSGRPSSSSASCSRCGRTSCRRTSSPSSAASRTTSGRSRSSEVERVIRGGARAPDRAALPRVRRRAARRRVDRAGAPRRAPERPPRRGQGAAARTRRARSRPTSRCSTRPRSSRRSACARSTSSTRASSSTSSRARSGRSSTTGSRRRNAERFRRNFAGHPHVRMPHVYWSYTRARVLTLEFLEGAQLADIDARRLAARASAARLAYLIAESVDDDDLPPRLLPRRPAPGEHPRARPPEQIGLVDFGTRRASSPTTT